MCGAVDRKGYPRGSEAGSTRFPFGELLCFRARHDISSSFLGLYRLLPLRSGARKIVCVSVTCTGPRSHGCVDRFVFITPQRSNRYALPSTIRYWSSNPRVALSLKQLSGEARLSKERFVPHPNYSRWEVKAMAAGRRVTVDTMRRLVGVCAKRERERVEEKKGATESKWKRILSNVAKRRMGFVWGVESILLPSSEFPCLFRRIPTSEHIVHPNCFIGNVKFATERERVLI